MLIDSILLNCNTRYTNKKCDTQCTNCSYGDFCSGDCGDCLDHIHNHSHAPTGAPIRKYDCRNMADFYVCKYSYRYTSELIYAFQRTTSLKEKPHIKILSFGCGPCTDLFALDYLQSTGEYSFKTYEYRGIDYSENVWHNIHSDIKTNALHNAITEFYYEDACKVIDDICNGTWTPDLVVFQYVFSDMHKHSGYENVTSFIDRFSNYVNNKMNKNCYIVINDINLERSYGGGRGYFDDLKNKIAYQKMRKGRFCDSNATSYYYPRGYTYGDDSDGEFPCNKNLFTWDTNWCMKYSPFNSCASAQMIIKR